MVGELGAGAGREGGGGERRSLYSSIAGLNKSARDKKNVLEVNLEKHDEKAKFKLEESDIENLMKTLKISRNDCEGIQVCPLGKPVVFITLKNEINIEKFNKWRFESIVVKEGISSSRIGPKGKREVQVQVIGLDVETKDSVVINYLDAHGDVNKNEKVIHHTFKGGFLDGLETGNRSYIMEVKKEISSHHIIDGTKVEIRFEGQVRSCGNCYRPPSECGADAIAKNCQSPRGDLAEVMKAHWADIGFEPQGSPVQYQENTVADNFEVQRGARERSFPVLGAAELDGNYESIKVVGIDKEMELDKLLITLKEVGLPARKEVKDLIRNKRIVHIDNLDTETCMKMKRNADQRNVSAPAKERIILKPLRAVNAAEGRDEVDDNETDNGAGKHNASLSPSSLNDANRKKQKGKTVMEFGIAPVVSTRSGRGGKVNP